MENQQPDYDHNTMKKFIVIVLLTITYSCFLTVTGQKSDSIRIFSGTYLGNFQRNYYGNEAPDRLDTIWRIYLGEGISPAYGNPEKLWKGAGWTGQPLVTEENGKTYLIQGAFDYHLKKIDAETGEICWQYRFDDILKGTGTIWENNYTTNPDERYVILQGSRRGVNNKINSEHCYSFRGISYRSGKELWRMNVKQTESYSRDVDGSALTLGDTGYLALENGLFTIFSPDFRKGHKTNNIVEPLIYKEILYYKNTDTKIHGGNIESESSPCYLDGRIYTTSGSGRVYGYNMKSGKVDWIFEIGADLDGSPVVTSDSCLLIPVEKQYIPGRGGVFKLDPSKDPDHAVVWFFPTGDRDWFHWEGGIIGSVAVNDVYTTDTTHQIAAFIGVDGYLYVVNHRQIDSTFTATGPDNMQHYPVPELLYKHYIGGTISTPIIVKNKLIAPLDIGLYLYEFDGDFNFTLLDKVENIQIDATPVVHNKRLYVASTNGYLYCFGDRKQIAVK